jgi:hypothetical protein
MQRNITECSDFFHVRPQTPGQHYHFFYRVHLLATTDVSRLGPDRSMQQYSGTYQQLVLCHICQGQKALHVSAL